ncbi:MAG TPA: low temperature requirement protein A [Solirubrobacterales bacterium]|nr:low temperature requirement protein A [Solirubrobacterales bacterium]
MTATARHAPAIERVSTLELFFDLVFVFTITQLTAVLAHHPSWEGLAQVVLMLGVIWWMYGGYAWLTNTVRADIGIVRLLLLGGMAGFMVLALVIPTAFSGDGPLFGVAYLLVVAIHAGLFLRASPASVAASFRGVVPYNLAMSALVILGGAIGGTVEYVLFAAAFAVGWFLPKGNDESGFEIGPAHFVERHGLVVIVAIGESVIAVGIGASQLEVDAGMIAVAVLGLALSACFWWTYFGGDDTRAEHALTTAPRETRPPLVIAAYGYWHIPILLGVIASASALEVAIAHASEELAFARALALGGGVAAYMLGEAMFRRVLDIGAAGTRLLVAAVAIATIPIGTEISAIAQIAVLVVAAAAALALERPPAEPLGA